MPEQRFPLPSMSALLAFEAVARRQGFARAAEELSTSQPAISRHIRNLEIRFGEKLFVRSGQGVELTPKGALFYAGVVQSLDVLQTSVAQLSARTNEVTLACSHAVSHLLLMPRYDRLRAALGSDVDVRVLTAEYNLTRAAIETGADIVFEYAIHPPKRAHVIVGQEAIKPLGTPSVIAKAMKALKGQATPPRLLNLRQPNFGWLEWSDWLATRPEAAQWQDFDHHDSYVFLLEQAARGTGLALGWRGFADAYIRDGHLEPLPGDWISKGTNLYARLTRFGEQNSGAKKCIALLENCF